MTPTRTEIALIAAALSKTTGGKAEDNLAAASELWLKTDAHFKEQQARDRERKKMKAQPGMTLEAFLKLKLPSISTPSLRQTRFHQFIAGIYLPKILAGKPVAGGIESLATSLIHEAKSGGVSVDAYPGFAEWCKFRVSEGRTKAAKMMHAKRKAARQAEQVAKDADREARAQKSRIEYHNPEMLAIIAEREQKAGNWNMHE